MDLDHPMDFDHPMELDLPMDLNLIVLGGRVATPPQLRHLESGDVLMSLVVSVATTHPRRRVDLIPVVVASPAEFTERRLAPGTRVWISGRLQRSVRPRSEAAPGRSRLEVVADQITVPERPTSPESPSAARG